MNWRSSVDCAELLNVAGHIGSESFVNCQTIYTIVLQELFRNYSKLVEIFTLIAHAIIGFFFSIVV